MNMAYRGVLLQWLLLILILKQVALENYCNGYWTQTLGSLYQVCRGRVTKAAAESNCLSQRSALASVSSYHERYMYRNRMRLVGNKFWIGLHKVDDELLWNNRMSAKNLSWVDASSANDSTDCFTFDLDKVSPSNCSEEAFYICQRWKVTSKQEELCPKGAYEDVINRECFWYTHMPLAKAGSQVVCSLKYGRLVEMRGRGFPVNIAMFLTHQMSSADSNSNPIFLWTPLLFQNGSFLFEDGTAFNSQDFQLFPLGEGECVVLVVVKGEPYALKRKPCLEDAIGLCQSNIDLVIKPPDWGFFHGRTKDTDFSVDSTFCPRGKYWSEYSETGFCYFSADDLHDVLMSWEDAREYCQRYGGDLASFHSEEEERYVLKDSKWKLSWLGLYYDFDSNSTLWADVTDVDYVNWGNGQPDTKDGRFRCAYESGWPRTWKLDYCGTFKQFLCKTSKQPSPLPFIPVTLKELPRCPTDFHAYLFDGSCYVWSSERFNWYRAQEFCENYGGNLVSLHSKKEVDFLLRLLWENRIYLRARGSWIGFNALGLDGAFKWLDRSPVNFINWDVGEPTNIKNQEKCASMNFVNGMWDDTNCNAGLNVICKKKNDTTTDTSIPVRTTPAPVRGYCKKGWHRFDDRCFLLIGKKKSMWKYGNEAGVHCNFLGGSLASVRNAREDAFLYYLMQDVKVDAWIGLHDSVYFGEYYWYDNSPLYYTNWDAGEPSASFIKENCVIISYGKLNGGRWKDIRCEKELPYICQTAPDPSILDPGPVEKTICPIAPGYIKQGSTCYKVFGVLASWKNAENACRNDKGHLVSINTLEDYAVVNYLAAKSLKVNETFWIGLQSTGELYLQWMNGWPMSLSLFGRNEPQDIHLQEKCFYTSSAGFWEADLCSEAKKFICQIKQDEPPKRSGRIKSRCPPDPLSEWIDIGTMCVSIELTLYVTWRAANYRCFSKGAHLASFHSLEELKHPSLKNATRPMFIGLTRNSAGGFMWTDGSAVDFVNWDQDEPEGETESCVEIRADNMKWRVVSCNSQKGYICAKKKDIIDGFDENGLPISAVITIVISVILITAAAVIIVFYLRPWKKKLDRFDISNRFSVSPNRPTRDSETSIESQFHSKDPNVDIQDTNVLYTIK